MNVMRTEMLAVRGNRTNKANIITDNKVMEQVVQSCHVGSVILENKRYSEDRMERRVTLKKQSLVASQTRT